MKRLACLLLAVTATVSANAKEIDPRSLEIIQVVLSSAISEVVHNWEITEPDAELIIADRTINCALPSSLEDLKRLNAASELLLAGKEAPEDAFTPRPVNPEADLVTHSGLVIPQELVRACWLNQPEAELAKVPTSAEVRVSREDAAVIDRLFRRDHETWKRLHPNARGVVRVSLPAYSKDKQRALLTVSRFTNGIGGAIVLYLVERREGRWEIAWRESVLLE